MWYQTFRMDVSLNEKLYQAVSRRDIIGVNKLLSKGEFQIQKTFDIFISLYIYKLPW